ncbi:E3 ubiquitin-protein ligase TRIM13-like [Eriocheir sinensis]|uniref:E3 ubiquitin-protein ligase TRIM13-like n=1 Tax=Eriocheir sinensis TaxID=95602 RepID=UPI0021C9202A|nr:E3 ubiquitin-protein ligase TRIM13-like [Eriocheir sinensis]
MAAYQMSTKGDNPEECPVCLTGFDDLLQRPRTLPCGHTVCTLCTDKLKEQGRVTCPECRVRHAVPEGGQFPVSYTIEAFIRRLRDGKAAAASPPPSAGKGKGAAGSAGKKGAAGLSKKMRSFLQEQEATVVAAITACQEAQSQLDQYEATLTGWGERQQQLEDSLQGLMDQSRSSRELLQHEKFRVAPKRKEAKKKEQELQAVREKLRTTATEQEAFKVVGEMVRYASEAEQVLKECQQCFPDAGILTTARKWGPCQAEDFRSLTQRTRSLLQAGRVFAVHQVGGQRRRHARISLEAGQPCLHALTDHPPPLGASTLQAEDFRSLTQRTSSLLQAGWVFAVHQVGGQRRRHARISLEAGQPCLHALTDHPPPLGASTLQCDQLEGFCDTSPPSLSSSRHKIARFLALVP